jgi:hypothetical protein
MFLYYPQWSLGLGKPPSSLKKTKYFTFWPSLNTSMLNGNAEAISSPHQCLKLLTTSNSPQSCERRAKQAKNIRTSIVIYDMIMSNPDIQRTTTFWTYIYIQRQNAGSKQYTENFGGGILEERPSGWPRWDLRETGCRKGRWAPLHCPVLGFGIGCSAWTFVFCYRPGQQKAQARGCPDDNILYGCP